MNKWINSTIGQLTTYQRAGGTPSTHVDEYYGGDIPFVTIEDITNSSRFLDKTEKQLSAKGLANSAAWLIKEPHILYSMYATVGKPVINRVQCATNQAIIALKESPLIDQTYLYYQLLFIRPQVYKFTAQTTQSNLNAGAVKKLPIAYPKDIGQQRKIAAILTSVDTEIEKTESLIVKYQQIKAGLMHDLFTRGVTANGKFRPPRDKAPALYKETPIGWIPKEWQIVRMIDLAEDRNGATTIGPFGSDLVASDYRLEGVPVVFVRNIKESGFEWNSEIYVSEKKAVKLNAHSVKAGEILATKMGLPPCIGCLYPEWMRNGVITADIIRLSANNKKVDGFWLTTAINHDRIKRQVAAITAGVTRPKVTLVDFRRIRIAKPELHEQKVISEILRIAQNKLDAECARLDKLKYQKLGLMHDLLTGKVPVKVEPEREPMEMACG